MNFLDDKNLNMNCRKLAFITFVSASRNYYSLHLKNSLTFGKLTCNLLRRFYLLFCRKFHNIRVSCSYRSNNLSVYQHTPSCFYLHIRNLKLGKILKK